jgi:TM2 domain-containing membrane protein YozV
MSLAPNTPTCRRCAGPLQVGAPACGTCGQLTGAAPAGPAVGRPVGVVAAKSTGIAVLLSVLWVGAGNLYAGSIGTGVALMLFDGLLALLALTGFGLIIAFPIWLVTCIVATVLAVNSVSSFNRRNGIVVR